MRYNTDMNHTGRAGMSRRSFLKGLGALALTALPACRRAQQYAIEPEDCPEWQRPGEAISFATSMPWPTGAIPLLAVCHDGLPTALQPNPHYKHIRAGLPAFVQAAITDLYSPLRPESPTFNGKAYPAKGMVGAFRAWRTALRDGRRIAFLFPVGHSLLRSAHIAQLRQFNGASFYEYDPVAEPRCSTFPALDELTELTLGAAADFNSGCASLAELTAALPQLDVLFIFTPADPAAFHPDFAEALQHTPAETVRFCLSAPDRTAELCRYTVPLTHFLEEWGAEADAQGNLCLRQPVTMPLRQAVSESEALHSLLTDDELPLEERPALSPDRALLLQVLPQAESSLRRGIVEGHLPTARRLPRSAPTGAMVHYLHPFYADGRFAHNPWLRETWFPLTGYAGAAEVILPGSGAATAVLVNGSLLPAAHIEECTHICLPLTPQTVRAPLPLNEQGAPPFPHRTSRPLPQHSTGTSRQHQGAATPQWALLIDISRCNGCSACTLACRSENNIPTVGQEDLMNHRDIQWLSIERYHDELHRTHYVPSACRQCENAPCEAVCPVHATVHTDQGLNAMVYPRCWGTRYCSAACPYEARHFNFRDYSHNEQALTARPMNPHVSVRTRGVMEKCTYCIQRLNSATSTDGSPPQTACQQACPRGAIRLVDLRHEPPTTVLTTFDAVGTRPRTLYLST